MAKPPSNLVASETALCALFIEEFNQQDGWTCYPETGGFDVLVVHASGRQIGVEAKLQLNAKVADQILPSEAWHRYGKEGPDHRLVIVRSITEANLGIARMLTLQGVEVWDLHFQQSYSRSDLKEEWIASFHVADRLWKGDKPAEVPDPRWGHFHTAWFDWNPPCRLELPPVAPTVPAGVPAPIRMTPWKVAALRVLARLRAQGSITAKEIADEGCSPSMWTQRWLARGEVRGQWIETERLPKFDEQHPESFAAAVAAFESRDEAKAA